MPATGSSLASLACALLVTALSAATGLAADDDEAFFGHALTAERGERLRLAATIDPEGWPALRALAREATSARDADPGASPGRVDPAVLTAIARIDGTIARLVAKLRPELRRAPLDALETVALAELNLLRAAEPEAAPLCSGYLWSHHQTIVALRYAARAEGRAAELARLRAIAAARAVGAVSPAYHSEQVTEEQEQLRGAGLKAADIATVFSDWRPPHLKSSEICRATIRYLEAVADYPATLKATVLAYRLSGDYGYGSESDD